MPSQTIPVSRRSVIEAVAASTIGTTIEWYDFFLTGIGAATIFKSLFFPAMGSFWGQIFAFGTFAVGFLARPIGGVVFGAMGDRVGRKAALVTTLLLMGISTLLIGFLPVYESIGVAAPLLLVLLRFLQGLGVGGEWGGAVLLALEYGHSGRRGFFASWPQLGVPLGLLAANGVWALCERQLGTEAFLEWGWRLPFFLSGLLIVVGLMIRLRILETPLFASLQEQNQVSKTPIREILVKHWRDVLLAAGSRLAENACFYLFAIWILTYGKDELHVDKSVIQGAIMTAAALELITMPSFGLLSDFWSRRGTYMAGCVMLMLLAWPYFFLLNTRQPAAIFLAVIISLPFVHSLLYGIQGALIPELFGTRLRCTGASLGYQLAAPFAGGLAPIIAETLLHAYPGEYWPLAAYIIIISVISLLCVWRLAETSRKQLSD